MRPDVQAPEPLLIPQEVADLLKISPKTFREYIHPGRINAIDLDSDGKYLTQAVSLPGLKGPCLALTSVHSRALRDRAVRVDLAFKVFFHLYITHQPYPNSAVRPASTGGRRTALTRTPLILLCHKLVSLAVSAMTAGAPRQIV